MPAKKQPAPIEDVSDSDRRVIRDLTEMAPEATRFGKAPDKVDVPQVTTAVDGCVINWTTRQQYNPKTKQKFDFDGHLIDDKSAH